MDTLAAARQALARFDQGEAIRLLETLRGSGDASAMAELGIAFCYAQKEFDAIELLSEAVGGERYQELFQILVDHFWARRTLAKKIKVNDTKGEAIWNRLVELDPGAQGRFDIKLSACLIVKNEERNLERCLTSLAGIVDEIVVVDTGSTDRTVEIAQKFNAKLGQFEWCQDFAAARNESLRLATGNWVLWIDADEEVAPNSRNVLFEGIIRPQFAGYFIRIVNFMSEDSEANQYIHTPVRLFQLRTGVQFEGRIHEQVLPSLKKLGLPCATLGSATLYHYGYQPSQMDEKSKLERTVGLLEREVADHPNDAFQWFNLANAYSVGRLYEKAIDAAQKSAALLTPDAPYGPTTYQIWASSLNLSGQSETALNVVQEAERRNMAPISVQFERAHALFRLHRFSEALAAIDATMAMDWPADLTGDVGVKTHKSHILKGQILTELGQFTEAHEALEFALSVDPTFTLTQFAIAGLNRREGRLEDAKIRLKEISQSPAFAMSAERVLGQIAADQLDWYTASVHLQKVWDADRQDIDAWIVLCQALERQGHIERLVEVHEQYALVHPPNADVLTNHGRFLLMLQRVEEALVKFTEATLADPAYANAYFNIGDTLYGMGDYLHAAEVYEQGIRNEPEFSDGWFVLGNCFAQMDHLEGAKFAYERAIALNPAHYAAVQNLDLISEAA